jgi:hypothetical protein
MSRKIKTVEFLQKHGVDKLKEKYFINVYRHEKYPNLIQLSYNQTLSNFSDEIVQECRGIVVDEKNNFKIISYPFDKFFNFGEKEAKSLDWKTCNIFEKHDGSMAILYFFEKDWHVGTTSRCDGSSHMCFVNEDEKVIPFRQLFWEIFQDLKYELPKDTGNCYIFEMTTPRHNLVVKHKKENLILLGARNLTTLEELNCRDVGILNDWEYIKPLDMKIDSLNGLKGVAEELDPTVCEGFVVCDSNWNRVKVKSPNYVLLSHLMFDDENSKKNKLLKVVQTNEGSEFLSYFPKYKEEYDKLSTKLQDIADKIVSRFEIHHKECNDQKEFAMVLKKKYPRHIQDIMFQLRKGENIKNIFKDSTFQKFEMLMNEKDFQLEK